MSDGNFDLATSQFLTNTATTSLNGICLVVAFPKSRSGNYAASVHFAKQANLYEEREIAGKLYHFSAFGKKRDQAAIALSVTNLLLKIKGTSFYAGGKLIATPYRIQSVLTCYLESCGTTDYRAHCHKVTNDPFQSQSQQEERFNVSIMDFLRGPIQVPAVQCIFPCRFLASYSGAGMSSQHPSSQVDQIQAAGVRHGCDWCPNFQPTDFKKL
jgi:hypothetical protein